MIYDQDNPEEEEKCSWVLEGLQKLNGAGFAAIRNLTLKSSDVNQGRIITEIVQKTFRGEADAVYGGYHSIGSHPSSESPVVSLSFGLSCCDKTIIAFLALISLVSPDSS